MERMQLHIKKMVIAKNHIHSVKQEADEIIICLLFYTIK